MGKRSSEGHPGSERLTEPVDEATDLVDVRGIWRGQILYAGIELGIFEAVGEDHRPATDLADELGVDDKHLYRLLRALSHYGVMAEDDDRRFRITGVGECFRADHPGSVRDLVRFFRGPEYQSAWTHLPDIVAGGGLTGFEREFEAGLFDYLDQNPELSRAFNGSMTRRTQRVTEVVLDALAGYDFEEFSRVCDIGGGHGHLLGHLLQEHQHLEGTVLELPSVVKQTQARWAPKLGVDDRCSYIAGDMFESVPEADAYLMKSILHDWNDKACLDILSTTRASALSDARLFVIERIVPGPNTQHAAKPSDINMMVSTGGRERTIAEFDDLFQATGWKRVTTWSPAKSTRSVIEVKAVN